MELKDFVVLVFATGAIVIGCFGKNFFYAKSVVTWSVSDKKAPLWLGRLFFIGIGVLLLIPELIHLFSENS
jgi:hypothetical protein